MIVIPYRYEFIPYGAATVMAAALLVPWRRWVRSRQSGTRSKLAGTVSTGRRLTSRASRVALSGLVAWAALTWVAGYNPQGPPTRIHGLLRGESSSQYFWNGNDPVSYRVGDTWVSFKHTTFNVTSVGQVWLGDEGTATILTAYPVIGSSVKVVTYFHQ